MSSAQRRRAARAHSSAVHDATRLHVGGDRVAAARLVELREDGRCEEAPRLLIGHPHPGAVGCQKAQLLKLGRDEAQGRGRDLIPRSKRAPAAIRCERPVELS